MANSTWNQTEVSGCDVGVQHQTWEKILWAQVSLVTLVRYFLPFSFPFLLVGILGTNPSLYLFWIRTNSLNWYRTWAKRVTNLCCPGTRPDLTLKLSMEYKLENNCSAFFYKKAQLTDHFQQLNPLLRCWHWLFPLSMYWLVIHFANNIPFFPTRLKYIMPVKLMKFLMP
jgi:hypothetical protein